MLHMSEIKDVTIDDIVKRMKQNNKKADTKIIIRAYEYAKSHHGDQLRKSGEPYIIHPIQVAYILATLELDESTICAALLHDVVEDTDVTIRDLAKEFSEEIARNGRWCNKTWKIKIYKCRGATSRKL